MRRPGRGLAAAGLVALLTLTACDDVPAPGPPDVDVDTRELRLVKEEAGVEPCVPGPGGPVEGGLPEVTLPCLGGGDPVDVSTLRGPLVVNFWQSFCGPCIEEMPALQEFHERYGDQVAVLGVDYQDVRPDAALELASETGVTYPLVADVGGELNNAGALPVLRGMPVLAFVDADGVVTEVEPGGITSVGEVVDLVEEHLGVRL